MTTGDCRMVDFLLVGVGGQGTILASDIVAGVGLRIGCDVKKAEVHGMSQRGGSVVSHVRWGRQVFSPIVAAGDASVLVAFEKLEAARFAHHLQPEGLAVINDYAIAPITVSAGPADYPDDTEIRARVARATADAHWVNGVEVAQALGNVRAANLVILGALSNLLQMDQEDWLPVVEAQVPPKYVALNRQAFLAGRGVVG